MATRAAIDCDLCGAKDLAEGGSFRLPSPRQPGEMEGGTGTTDLCPLCVQKVLRRMLQTSKATHEEFRAAIMPLRSAR